MNIAFTAIIIADIWQWTPFVFIMMIAALANMDSSVIEASKIDGATWWQSVWLVKLPLIQNVIVITLLMRLIDALGCLRSSTSLPLVAQGIQQKFCHCIFTRPRLSASAWALQLPYR